MKGKIHIVHPGFTMIDNTPMKIGKKSKRRKTWRNPSWKCSGNELSLTLVKYIAPIRLHFKTKMNIRVNQGILKF